MGRAEHVLKNLEGIVPEVEEVIVVDYCCPQNVGNRVNKHFPSATVIYAGRRRYFNLSIARNLGLEAVSKPWVFFLDADIVLSKGFLKNWELPKSTDKFFLLGRMRRMGATGSMIAPTFSVRALGGYDHRYIGYGGEDYDIFLRLGLVGLKQHIVESEPAIVLKHSVEDRVTNFKEKEREKSLLIGKMYRHIKMQLAREYGDVNLPDKLLDDLYARVESSVGRDHSQKGDITIAIDISPKDRKKTTRRNMKKKIFNFKISN